MTDAQVTPEEHSGLVGGSTAARRIGCPASYRREQLAPPDKGNAYAREGTALHELIAHTLLHDTDPVDLLPFTFKHDEGWSFTVDAHLWDDKGRPALETFDAFLDQLETEYDDDFEFLVEERVEFPGLPGAFGTADIVGKCGGTIHVIDWKFGRGRVEADENPQLMFYARAALNTLTGFLPAVEPDTPVMLTIIQPAADGRSTFSTTFRRLDDFRIELIEAVDEAQRPNARMQIGPWCRFARCKAECPLHAERAAELSDKWAGLAAMARKRTGEAAPDVETPVTLAELADAGEAHPEELSVRLSRLLPLVEVVEDWCDAVRKAATAHAEEGHELPGYKLTAGRPGPRKWAVPDEEVMKFFKNRRFTLDQYAPRKIVSMPQGEKLLGAAGKSIPDDMVVRPPASGYKLVRESNDAEAVRPPAEVARSLRESLRTARGNE